MERDEQPRVVATPEDLAIAFSGNTAARAAYQGLSYSMQKEYAQWIEEAKRPDTRARRVQRSLDMLLAGQHPKK
jgi:uncharacterized protein YdeI (YjbR/CyaY-like superfamily)